MFQDDEGEWVDDECPRCMVGRIQVVSKPFLRLHRKHLFTMPDAVCYECDVCGFYEFDEASYDIIDKMVDSEINHRQLYGNTSHVPPKMPLEDDAPKQTKFPPA